MENEDWSEFTPPREVTHWMSAEFQRFIRDEGRVAAAWKRIKQCPALLEKSAGMPENWDSVKRLLNRNERMKDIYAIEAEYLQQHPESGYFTEILKLAEFPDYIDYFPEGAIVRKIGVMGYIPQREVSRYPYLAMSEDEYKHFVNRTTELVVEAVQ